MLVREVSTMITHLAIAKRFKAGESIADLAWWLSEHPVPCRIVPLGFDRWGQYVEHALRTVLRRQGRRRIL